MCEYISGLISDDGTEIKIADPLSHSGTRNRLGLPVDWGREWEWTDNGLSVRVPPEPFIVDGEPMNESAYKATILSRWPTRGALEKYLSTDTDVSVRRCVAGRLAVEHLPAMMDDLRADRADAPHNS